MREPITRADLDEATMSVGSHQGTADQLIAWAQDPHPRDVVSARELVTRAGEYRELADDGGAAETLYRQALALPGEAILDPRCHLISILLRRGDTAEAVELDDDLRRSTPASPPVYEYVAGTWVELGDTRRAMGWYNRGIRRHESGHGFSPDDLGSLCWWRWRLREEEGHPPDEYDLVGVGWAKQAREARTQGHR